jgi:predicted acyltransferase (DUF342 family)
MKKVLFWLARIFKVDLTVEKIIYKDRIVEKIVALEGTIDNNVTVKGNLYVTGDIYVAGNISAHGGIVSGMSIEEVKMQAEKEISAYKAMED